MIEAILIPNPTMKKLIPIPTEGVLLPLIKKFKEAGCECLIKTDDHKTTLIVSYTIPLTQQKRSQANALNLTN